MFDAYFDLSYAERTPYAIAAAILLGLFFGYFMSKESNKRVPVYGGSLALVFHYLAASAMLGLLSVVILGIISGFHFFRLFPIAICFALVNQLLLLSYGYLESKVDHKKLAPVRQLD